VHTYLLTFYENESIYTTSIAYENMSNVALKRFRRAVRQAILCPRFGSEIVMYKLAQQGLNPVMIQAWPNSGPILAEIREECEVENTMWDVEYADADMAILWCTVPGDGRGMIKWRVTRGPFAFRWELF